MKPPIVSPKCSHDTEHVVCWYNVLMCDECFIQYFAVSARVVDSGKLLDRIVELEVQLAAVPRWTRITDDSETWPPRDMDAVLLAADGSHFVDWHDRWDYENTAIAWIPIPKSSFVLQENHDHARES